MYKLFVKRVLDFVLSLIAIIVLSPVYLIVAILVRTKLGVTNHLYTRKAR